MAIFSPSGYMLANEGSATCRLPGKIGRRLGDAITSFGGRTDGTITDLTAAPSSIGQREPSGYAFENQNTQHVVYQGLCRAGRRPHITNSGGMMSGTTTT